MERYLLFYGNWDDPGGGWEDFEGDYDTAEEALSDIGEGDDWYHIVDIKTGAIVKYG